MEPLRKEGYLEKQGVMKFLWKKYWFFLDGSRLTYYKDDNKRLPVLGAVDMTKVQTVKRTNSYNHGHDLEILTRSKTLVLSAPSNDECNNWIECLQQGMQFERRKSSFASQPSFFSASEDAPEYYDDCRSPNNTADTELYEDPEVFYANTDLPNNVEPSNAAQDDTVTKPGVVPPRSLASDEPVGSTGAELEDQVYEELGDSDEIQKRVSESIPKDEFGDENEEQDIYDTIRDDDCNTPVSTTANETSRLSVNKPTLEKTVAINECDSSEQEDPYTIIDNAEDLSYSSLSFKQKSAMRKAAPGYSDVVLPKPGDTSTIEPDQDYDDIAQLVQREPEPDYDTDGGGIDEPHPVPKAKNGAVLYSQAVNDIKEYLENNRPGSELYIPPVFEGEEGNGILLMKEYLKGFK